MRGEESTDMNLFNFIPDPRTIVGQKVVETGISQSQELINELTGNNSGIPDASITLHEIRLLLIEIATFLQAQQSVMGDIYHFVYIYKSGFGPPYIPVHEDNRQNFQIFNGTSYTLNVSAPGMSTFNLATKASDWTNTSFPDGTQYYLDAGASVNVVTFYQRDTNASIV